METPKSAQETPRKKVDRLVSLDLDDTLTDFHISNTLNKSTRSYHVVWTGGSQKRWQNLCKALRKLDTLQTDDSEETETHFVIVTFKHRPDTISGVVEKGLSEYLGADPIYFTKGDPKQDILIELQQKLSVEPENIRMLDDKFYEVCLPVINANMAAHLAPTGMLLPRSLEVPSAANISDKIEIYKAQIAFYEDLLKHGALENAVAQTQKACLDYMKAVIRSAAQQTLGARRIEEDRLEKEIFSMLEEDVEPYPLDIVRAILEQKQMEAEELLEIAERQRELRLENDESDEEEDELEDMEESGPYAMFDYSTKSSAHFSPSPERDRYLFLGAQSAQPSQVPTPEYGHIDSVKALEAALDSTQDSARQMLERPDDSLEPAQKRKKAAFSLLKRYEAERLPSIFLNAQRGLQTQKLSQALAEVLLNGTEVTQVVSTIRAIRMSMIRHEGQESGKRLETRFLGESLLEGLIKSFLYEHDYGYWRTLPVTYDPAGRLNFRKKPSKELLAKAEIWALDNAPRQFDISLLPDSPQKREIQNDIKILNDWLKNPGRFTTKFIEEALIPGIEKKYRALMPEEEVHLKTSLTAVPFTPSASVPSVRGRLYTIHDNLGSPAFSIPKASKPPVDPEMTDQEKAWMVQAIDVISDFLQSSAIKGVFSNMLSPLYVRGRIRIAKAGEDSYEIVSSSIMLNPPPDKKILLSSEEMFDIYQFNILGVANHSLRTKDQDGSHMQRGYIYLMSHNFDSKKAEEEVKKIMENINNPIVNVYEKSSKKIAWAERIVNPSTAAVSWQIKLRADSALAKKVLVYHNMPPKPLVESAPTSVHPFKRDR